MIAKTPVPPFTVDVPYLHTVPTRVWTYHFDLGAAPAGFWWLIPAAVIGFVVLIAVSIFVAAWDPQVGGCCFGLGVCVALAMIVMSPIPELLDTQQVEPGQLYGRTSDPGRPFLVGTPVDHPSVEQILKADPDVTVSDDNAYNQRFASAASSTYGITVVGYLTPEELSDGVEFIGMKNGISAKCTALATSDTEDILGRVGAQQVTVACNPGL